MKIWIINTWLNLAATYHTFSYKLTERPTLHGKVYLFLLGIVLDIFSLFWKITEK